MIEAEQGGSMYDFVDDSYQAPPIEQKPVREGDSYIPEAPKSPVREENWQANREPGDNKYNNKTTQTHSAHYERKEQKNESAMGFWRMFTQQMPKGEFEQSVTTRFGGKMAIGADFRGKKEEYITMYKAMLKQWNSEL